MGELTTEEKSAIDALKRLATKWPKSLWLFSGAGTLHVMRFNPDGSRMVGDFGCMDANASVATINIHNDGGDW